MSATYTSTPNCYKYNACMHCNVRAVFNPVYSLCTIAGSVQSDEGDLRTVELTADLQRSLYCPPRPPPKRLAAPTRPTRSSICLALGMMHDHRQRLVGRPVRLTRPPQCRHQDRIYNCSVYLRRWDQICNVLVHHQRCRSPPALLARPHR